MLFDYNFTLCDVLTYMQPCAMHKAPSLCPSPGRKHDAGRFKLAQHVHNRLLCSLCRATVALRNIHVVFDILALCRRHIAITVLAVAYPAIDACSYAPSSSVLS